MKKRILITALLLGASSAMLTGFDSAATAEDVMAKYTEAANAVTDFNADIDMNLAVGLAMDVEGVGVNMDVAMLGDLSMDFIKDPLAFQIGGNMSVTIPGSEEENMEMQVYMVPGEEGAMDIFAYVNEGDEGEWEYISIPAEEMAPITEIMNTQSEATLPIGTLSLGEEAVDVNGTSCYQLINTVTYEDLESTLQEALAATGELGDEETVESSLAMVGMALSGIQLNMEIYVDSDTYLPVKAHIDFDGSDLSSLSQILSYSMAQTDEEGNTVFPELSLDISNLYMDVVYDYSAPTEIVVPEEGLQAKADSDDTLDDLTGEVFDEIA